MGLLLCSGAHAENSLCDFSDYAGKSAVDRLQTAKQRWRRYVDQNNLAHTAQGLSAAVQLRLSYGSGLASQIEKVCQEKNVCQVSYQAFLDEQSPSAGAGNCQALRKLASDEERARAGLGQFQGHLQKSLSGLQETFKTTAAKDRFAIDALSPRSAGVEREYAALWGAAGLYSRLLGQLKRENEWSQSTTHALESYRDRHSSLAGQACGTAGAATGAAGHGAAGAGNAGAGGASSEISGGKNGDPAATKAGSASGDGSGKSSGLSLGESLAIGGGLAAVAGGGAVLYMHYKDGKAPKVDVNNPYFNQLTATGAQQYQAAGGTFFQDTSAPFAGAPGLVKETNPTGTMYFFPPLAKLLEDWQNAVPAETIKKPTLQCPAHQQLSSGYPALNPRDDFLGACETVAKGYKNIRDTGTVCQEVEDPVAYFASLPPTQPEVLKMGSLENILDVFAPAVASQLASMPGAFIKQAYYDKLHGVLVNFRIGTIRDKIVARQGYLQALLNDLNAGGHCSRPADDGARKAAVDLYSRAYQESAALLSELQNIESAAVAAANRDKAKATTAGRTRDSLLYPALSDDQRFFLSTFLGALLWRARGGGMFNDLNSNLRRVDFTLLPMQELASTDGGSAASGIGTDIWIELFSTWGQNLRDISNSDSATRTKGWQAMQARGTTQVQGMVSKLKGLHYDALDAYASGPMLGDCYLYAEVELFNASFGAIANSGTDMIARGELCAGAAIGYGMASSLLKGHN